MINRKKLIEVALPLEAINKASAREKSIRHGHPSTLHLWWARRPLAAARAVIFAQMVDDPSAHPDRFPTAEPARGVHPRHRRVSKSNHRTLAHGEGCSTLFPSPGAGEGEDGGKSPQCTNLLWSDLDGDAHRVHYVRRPFRREPDFGVTSVNYDLAELLARAEEPR